MCNSVASELHFAQAPVQVTTPHAGEGFAGPNNAACFYGPQSHWQCADQLVHLGLAGLQTAEASQLVGVWLTARCASMEGLAMSVAHYPRCLAMLAAIGLLFRALACASLFLVDCARQR